MADSPKFIEIKAQRGKTVEGKARKRPKTIKKMKTEKEAPIVIAAKPGLFSEEDCLVESSGMQVKGLNITIGEVSSISTQMMMSLDEPTAGKSTEEEDIKSAFAKKRYIQKFRNSWCKIPEFQGWLAEGNAPNKAYCTVCSRDLIAGKSELLRHSKGERHKKKMLDECPSDLVCLRVELAPEMGLPQSVSIDDLSFQNDKESQIKNLIDLRSDTVTRPDRGMKTVMFEATMGDDAFGEDTMVNTLQKKVAEMLGKEAALYVPSGTMANLVSVLTHCWGRGSDVVVGDESYLYRKTHGGMALVGGVHHRLIKNLPDGTFSLNELRTLIQENDPICPVTTLICVENTHNRLGGKALPLRWLDELGALCEELNLQLHMDGARLMNASVALGLLPSRLVEKCNSVAMCLNKGLGAPMGSLIVGTKDFIARATKIRKILGGSLHQCGMMAAAGIYALDHIVPQLFKDHHNARAIAHSVLEEHSSAITVDVNAIQTNIGFLNCDNIRVDAKKLCLRLQMVTDSEADELGEKIIVMMLPVTDTVVRFMTHHEVKKEHVKAIKKKLKYIIHEYDNIMYVDYKMNV